MSDPTNMPDRNTGSRREVAPYTATFDREESSGSGGGIGGGGGVSGGGGGGVSGGGGVGSVGDGCRSVGLGGGRGGVGGVSGGEACMQKTQKARMLQGYTKRHVQSPSRASYGNAVAEGGGGV